MAKFLETHYLKLILLTGVLWVIAIMILIRIPLSSGNGHGGENRVETDMTCERRECVPIAEPLAGHPARWDESRWR